MGKHLFRITIAVVALFLAFGGPGVVLAQEEEAEEEFTLEEITVTAQKREENQQKVPIAMEVITGEDLVSMGRDSVDEILKDIANISINTASDGMRISLRGIADDSNVMDDQHVGGSTVSINVDGSYNNMSNAGQNLYDIERVEVLFGPQSTMYGSNAPGGIVNVVTASPKTDRYSANATIEYGSFDLLNLNGVLNVPVIRDKVALRLAANRYEQGSFVDKDQDPNKTTSARLRALWNIYDDLTVSVTGNWSERSNGGMMGGSVVPFVDQDDVDDPWTSDTSDEEDPILGAPQQNRNDQETRGVSANIDWETPFGSIALVPSYSKSTSEGRQSRTSGGGPGGPPGGPPGPPGGDSGETEIQYFWQEQSNTQKGAELRMTNAADFELFEWIFGGTYYDSEQYRSQDYEDPTTVDTSRSTVQKKTAVYANITYPLWFHDPLRLTVGYRQSWDENNSTSVGGFMAGTSGNPEEYSKPDMKYGFEYDAADNLMFYGSYSSSYRSGDAMAMPDASGDYPDPEELDSYSVGAKSRWLDNRLQVNLAAYYYDYENKLCTGFKEALDITEEDLGGDYISIGVERGRVGAVLGSDGEYPTLDPDTGEPFTFDLHDPNSQGTGTFESFGMDLQTTWLITSRDRLNFSVSYLDAEWVDLHFHYYWHMYWPDEDYEGVTPTNSPKWSFAASYEHNFMLGALGTLTPRIDMQSKSETSMVWNPADKDPYGYGTQEAYVLWDASASFKHSSNRWSLNAYVKNITNYAVKRSYMGMMSFTMMIGDPRTYGVTFSMNF
jgi:iron complex outermembrane receptor protein